LVTGTILQLILEHAVRNFFAINLIYIYIYIYIYTDAHSHTHTHTHTHFATERLWSGKRNQNISDNSKWRVPRKHFRVSFGARVPYVRSVCPNDYADVKRLRTSWKSCGLFSVQRTQPFNAYIIHKGGSGYILQLQ